MAGTKGGTPPTKPPAVDRTKTGGNGDDEGRSLRAQLDALSEHVGPGEPEEVVKSRKEFVTADEFSFNPATLVGSWFHRLENDLMVWQGVIVAEPQPGVYLAQIDRLDLGAENVQRLVTMAQLTADEDGYDWRFYDTEAEAKSAYAAWVATERERV
jgi:hypothetical protein